MKSFTFIFLPDERKFLFEEQKNAPTSRRDDYIECFSSFVLCSISFENRLDKPICLFSCCKDTTKIDLNQDYFLFFAQKIRKRLRVATAR